MPKEIVLQVLPHMAADMDLLKEEIAIKMAIDPQLISYIHILKKSIDARQRTIWINIKANVYFDEIVAIPVQELPNFETVTNNREVVIIGAGPAGLFAALKAIELGLKPILLERGKDVRARRRDLKIINQDHIVNPDSNYCFGEGGAGTYSDGKLYTRSDKRGQIKKVLELLPGDTLRQLAEKKFSARPAQTYDFAAASEATIKSLNICGFWGFARNISGRTSTHRH